MKAIGKTIRSKVTGKIGTITGLSGGKISVTFDGHASITASIDLFDIDPELRQVIEEETRKQDTNTARTYRKRNHEQIPASSGRIDHLDAKDKCEFYRIDEVLNNCFGTDYQAWMKGTWPLNDYYWCWFPKLVKSIKDEPASNGCINVISEDWNTIIYDETKDSVADTSSDQHNDRAIVFAREPDNGPILFRGVYVFDRKRSSYKHYIYKRVSSKIRIIGNPAYDIETLDKIV